MDPAADFKIQDLDLKCKLIELRSLLEKLATMDTSSPEFLQLFDQVYGVMSVKEEFDECEYLCSEASLSLLPEYHCRKTI